MSVKSMKKQGGFTLLELLIVIVIIGILALVIIPGLASGPARARDAQRKNDLRSIQNALQTYFNDNNAYPSASTTNVVPASNAVIKAALVPTYIKKTIPDDPKSNQHYEYKCTTVTSGSCTAYQLEAKLENGKDSQINDPSLPNGYVVTSAD